MKGAWHRGRKALTYLNHLDGLKVRFCQAFIVYYCRFLQVLSCFSYEITGFERF